jgi:membrane protein YqaA with SNARE-associated domain
LGGLSFAESSFFPIPPDVMLAPMCLAQPQRWFRFALITTLTSVAGGVFGYVIGAWAIDAVMPWVAQTGWGGKIDLAKAWFADWGFWAVLLAGFSPIPYKAFTIAAGSMAMPLLPFVLASILGRGGRFFLVGWLMGRFGPAMEPKLRPIMEWLGWGTVALAAVAYAYFQWR